MNKNLLTHLGVGIGAAAIGAGVTAGLALGGQFGPPDSCVAALDAADEFIVLNTEFGGHFITLAEISSDAVQAAVAWDSAALDANTADIEDLAAEVTALSDRAGAVNYDGPAAECRGGA